MERSEFRQRMDQFKQARESNPQLSYWEWKNSLPDNLAHTPDWQYNNFGAYTGGLKPELNEDGYYHLGSRNPYTGEILKPKSHPTYDKAIQNDVAAGYFPYEKNGITYTKTYSPTGDISGYANGTDGIREQEDRQYVIDWFDKRKKYNNPVVQRQLNQISENRSLYNYNIETSNPALKTYYESQAVNTVPVTYKNIIEGHDDYGGYYHPNEGVVIKRNSLKDKTFEPLVHEFSHVINSNPSNNSINNTINNIIYKQSIYNKGDFFNEYLTRPEEIHSRLMEFRKLNNLDPTKSVTMPQLKKLKKTGVDRNLFDLFVDDNVVLDLLNNVASVNKSDITRSENGTDGIQSNTSEIPVTYSNGKWNYGYNPGAGFLKPVVSIQDVADLTPVGNAITANDVYQSASQGDYITAGLIGAAALLPNAISRPLKKIVREIPSVNPKYFSDKINKVLGREVRPNGLSRDVYTDAINQRNRVIEDLYTDQDYWNRARAINKQYGDDYTKVYKGVLDTYENKYTGLPEPKAKSFFGDTKAEMAARKDAMERFRMNKIPAGYTDFEYNISPHLDRIDRPTAQHELGHYVDFNLSQNANADYNNNMFSALRSDLSTDNNPLYPDKTDYFRQGTEQKSYMNTLRSYMQSIGLMDRPGQKVTTKTIKRAINSLPSEMNAVRAAYLQFNSPGEYTKWFNKIPLLSIPGAAMYFDSKEDNSYADGTDGIKYYGAYSPKQQAYVLPVYDDKGENNVVLPEVTVTPQNNTDLAGYMQKGDFIKEAMSFTPVGDVEDIYNIGKDIYDKNYAQAALGAGLLGTITGYGIRENNERNNYIQLMQQQGISPDLLDDRMFKSYYLTKKRNPKKAQDILQKQIKTLKNESN